jgi:serine/threonine protein kinase
MKLVDFGFARALTPAECGVENNNQRRPSISDLIQRGITNEQTRRRSSGNGAVEENDDAAINDTLSKLRRKSFFTRRSNSLDEEEMVNGATTTTDDSSSSRRRSSLFGRKFKRLNSIEKKPIRAMSALGTLDYAAPEVKNSRDKCEGDVALTDLVADYGLIADAYSVGCTIREILTGVPAKEARNEMDFMSTHQNSIDLVALFSCCTGTSNSNNKRKKRKRRYKWLDETPKLARELVLKMMNIKIADRLTVPLAREELWIKGGMSSDDPIVTLPVGDVSAGINDPIDFLQCTTTMVTE